ncbi:MAG: RNA-binding S4 domain-containing protein [Candidatus Bruticola sp.]
MTDFSSSEESVGSERIRLGQFLKLVGIVGTGGEGKLLIQQGCIIVDGQPCLQRGRHLNPSDIVEVNGRKYRVSDYL